MPGDKQDTLEFREKAIENTQLHIDVVIPNLFVYLPNKDFLEVIYNRLERTSSFSCFLSSLVKVLCMHFGLFIFNCYAKGCSVVQRESIRELIFLSTAMYIDIL